MHVTIQSMFSSICTVSFSFLTLPLLFLFHKELTVPGHFYNKLANAVLFLHSLSIQMHLRLTFYIPRPFPHKRSTTYSLVGSFSTSLR